MQKKDQPVAILIGDIKETFFVRKVLDEKRVQFFIRLYEGGVEVPPIKVVRDSNELVDGRHRKAALEALRQTHAQCIVREPAPRWELIMEALADNIGGALPPTQADINFVIRQLIDISTPKVKIVESILELTPFSRKLVMRHIDEVMTEKVRSNLRKAVRAVVEEGKTVMDAAEKNGVELDALKKALNNTTKVDSSSSGYNWNEVTNTITGRFKSASISNASLLGKLFKSFELDEISESELRVILEKISHSIKQMKSSHDHWIRRFNALINLQGSSSEGKPALGHEKQTKKRKRVGKSAAELVIQKMGLD